MSTIICHSGQNVYSFLGVNKWRKPMLSDQRVQQLRRLTDDKHCHDNDENDGGVTVDV